MMFFHPLARREKSSSAFEHEQQGSQEEEREGSSPGGQERPSSSGGGADAVKGTPEPTSKVRMRLKTILDRAVSDLPESPHNRVCESYGTEFTVFLRFKGRTRMATWTQFDTLIDLQRSFFAVFHFPERVLTAFLLNKVRLVVVPQRRRRNGKVTERAPELLSVLSQIHPGIIIEAHSDMWEAWCKHASSGQLVRRFSLDGRVRGQKQKSLTRRIDLVLNEPDSGRLPFALSMLINLLILVSSVTFVVETLPLLKDTDGTKGVLRSLETFCVSAFTVEIIARFLVAEDQGKFVRNAMNVVDFIAIMPFYIDLFSSETPIPGLSILRVLRLARVLRLFKVMKTFVSVLSGTVSSSSTPLSMLTFFLSITMVLFSSILYYAERGTYDEELEVWRRRAGFLCPYVCLQREHYLGCEYEGHVVDIFTTISVGKLKDSCQAVYEQSPFDSIISTFWVVCQTMTVVGYGDTEILSPLGKFIGTCTVLTGILTLALPISIVETNFSREMASFRKKTIYLQIQKTIKRELSVK